MKSFRKVAIKPSTNRHRLGRINTSVSKHNKTPSIIKVHDLDLNPMIVAMISNILPQIEKLSSFNFPEPVKTALIANIVDQATQMTPESSPFQSILSEKSDMSSAQKFSTPKPSPSHENSEYPHFRDSLMSQLSPFYNTQRQVLDSDGVPIPGGNIDRVASWMKKSAPPNTRGPVGTEAIALNYAQSSDDLPLYIRNQNFIQKTDNIRKALLEHHFNKRRKVKEKFSRREKPEDQEGAGKWQSLEIRY